jgi:hypothetical protein
MYMFRGIPWQKIAAAHRLGRQVVRSNSQRCFASDVDAPPSTPPQFDRFSRKRQSSVATPPPQPSANTSPASSTASSSDPNVLNDSEILEILKDFNTVDIIPPDNDPRPKGFYKTGYFNWDEVAQYKEPKTPLVEELFRTIQVRNYTTVADFMSMCLYHPLHGYYATKEVLGKKGDFVTSPEISQLFGEMMAVW